MGSIPQPSTTIQQLTGIASRRDEPWGHWGSDPSDPPTVASSCSRLYGGAAP